MTDQHSSISVIAGQLLAQLTPEQRQKLLLRSRDQEFIQAVGVVVDGYLDMHVSSVHYMVFQQLGNGTDPATAIFEAMRDIEARRRVA